MNIPFFRPVIGDDEIAEVVDCLKSGWLTTGPKAKRFEAEFAAYVGAKHAIALNSATAALHLALDAIGLRRGDAVLVPTMTFAATAEVVRYFDAIPVLVDCHEHDFNLNVAKAREAATETIQRGAKLKAVMPVHYGGQVCDMAGIKSLAGDFNLKVIEDAAHCCPASYRDSDSGEWLKVGAESDVACYSFYANKCITTGEGGMACTNDDGLAERIRVMGLHGISKDAWKRFTAEGSWYYEIVAPGFKYNLTDVAASIGIHQLKKADAFRNDRERVALLYGQYLKSVEEIILPTEAENRIHSWHLFAVRLRIERITVDRAEVIQKLKHAGIGASVHWMPLHMHPYYRNTYGYRPEDFPVSARLFQEIISLPIYPGLGEQEVAGVCDTLKDIISRHRRY